MLSEQRLSVTFGAFSCDVVGYDDPFSILNHVASLFGDIAKSNPAFGAGEVRMSDMERARVAAGFSDQASRIEELADQSAGNGLRYVVTNTEGEAQEPAPIEEELIVAAEADDGLASGDLELRYTLEAAEAEHPAADLGTVALDIAPGAQPEPVVAQAELAPEVAEVEVSPEVEPAAVEEIQETAEIDLEEDQTAIIEAAAVTEASDTAAEEIAPEIDTTAAETEVAIQKSVSEVMEEISISEAVTDDVTTTVTEIDTAAEAPVAEDEDEDEDVTATIVAATSDEEPEAKPIRRPLLLNVPNEKADEAPVAEAPSESLQAKKPRVTVTKLPLRPAERAKVADRPAAVSNASLTSVQKVEPVVTLNTVITDSADEAPRLSRAERVKARMDKRDSEDEGDNFLFADVDGVEQSADGGEAVRAVADEVASKVEAPVVVASQPDVEDLSESEKKQRRSFASLLGFGKSAKSSKEPASAPEAPVHRTEPELSYTGSTDGFDRLRESVAAAMPAPEEPEVSFGAAKSDAQPDSTSEAIDYDDETSPTVFARRVGAKTLQDLLEASAVYMDTVEGKSRFSRRDVMQTLNTIGADKDYTQEARLKSFRKLLTTGSLVRVDNGMFTVSQATRFGYETQLQA